MAIAIAGLGKGRIEALADGIFATVMTVLVLSLSVPTIVGGPDNQALLSYVLGLGSTVLSYVMSFLILGVFWVRHHNIFHFISKIDTPFIWVNIIFLLTIGFIPFSTELLGRYPDAEVSSVVYGLNLIATGICMQGIWRYATRHKLLISDGLNEENMNRVNRRLTGGPLLYASAILVSLLTGVATIAFAIYLLAIIYYVSTSSFGFWVKPRSTLKRRLKEKDKPRS